MASISDSHRTCNFCHNKSQYTCPRCNVPYCSSKCYKHQSHVQCSEGFFEEMVKAELGSGTVSEESRQKMMEILQRVKAGESGLGEDEDEPLDSDDDEDEEDLNVRMADVDLNDSDTVWKKLTEEERQEFRELINKGALEDLIPPWSPWWEQEVPKVQEIKPGSQSPPGRTADCPEVIEVPLLSEVMKASPAPCIPFNILNVLSAYAWTVRLFNGDHQESSLDATEAILLLSKVLATNANFEAAATAVESPKMEAQNHPWLMESEDFASTVKSDVWKILQGPAASDQTFYVRAALSEIHMLLNTSRATLSKKKKSTGGRKGLFSSSFMDGNEHIELKISTLPTVKLALKKVEFLLSYIKEYSAALISISIV
ncbi:zinc finger HIT domain-containing protein 2-like [Homarus americanus]|uniref:zinc finger HIT domain-containing protein 2-like n=1 Tax=Homarus americanus TaxID=6706 RepID=UPI001C48CE9A|nr:zinc finger HIT domain-containing protein 2-like [Homarus americanus]